jgi:hypothetical protein
MSDFSISGAWNHGTAMLAAVKRTTFGYLGLALLIPFLIFSIHDGSNFRTFFALVVSSGVSVASAETPWTILSLFVLSAIGIGSIVLAAWNAMLSASRDGPVGEIMYGLVAGLICAFVGLVIYIALSIPFAVLLFVVTMAVGGSAEYSIAIGVVTLVLQLLSTLTFAWLCARLCLAGPAMASAGSLNPFAALATSWRLTGRAQWRIFFVMLAAQIVAFLLLVAIIALGAILIQGTYDFGWQDSVISIAWVVVEAILVLMLLVVPMGLYRELAPQTDTSVFE